MLKFLEERQTTQYNKSSYKPKPYISFGVSLEAPSTFQNDHSMISPTNYINPFVSIQNRNHGGLSSRKAHAPAHWTHKTDILRIEQGKVVGNEGPSSQPDRYHRSYYNQLNKNSSRFRLTKGQFTNEIEKIRVGNQVFGPLAGEQRSAEKSLQTKRSIIKRSHLHLQKSRDKLEMQKTLRKQSSRVLEKLIDERRLVRSKREQFYSSYRKELTERKSPKHDDYTLPKVLVHHENKPRKVNNFGIFKTLDNSMLTRMIK